MKQTRWLFNAYVVVMCMLEYVYIHSLIRRSNASTHHQYSVYSSLRCCILFLTSLPSLLLLFVLVLLLYIRFFFLVKFPYTIIYTHLALCCVPSLWLLYSLGINSLSFVLSLFVFTYSFATFMFASKFSYWRVYNKNSYTCIHIAAEHCGRHTRTFDSLSLFNWNCWLFSIHFISFAGFLSLALVIYWIQCLMISYWSS